MKTYLIAITALLTTPSAFGANLHYLCEGLLGERKVQVVVDLQRNVAGVADRKAWTFLDYRRMETSSGIPTKTSFIYEGAAANGGLIRVAFVLPSDSARIFLFDGQRRLVVSGEAVCAPTP